MTTDGTDASAETVALLSRLDIAPQAVSITSAIPQAAGLGSSAALLVATAAASMDELDQEAVFVSSANFTNAGQERNIEVGLLVRSPIVARQLARHFVKLVDVGLMEKVSG